VLLIKTGKTLCWDCHDDFLTGAKFKHSSVDTCADCHTGHVSEQAGLLKKPPGPLCLDCHEQKDLDAVKGHQGMGSTPCLKCHDAHIGQEKYLLKGEALNAAKASTSPPAKK
jgi:predicted CXXCH cytochrome family protein